MNLTLHYIIMSNMGLHVKRVYICQIGGYMSNMWVYVKYVGTCQIWGICQIGGYMSNMWVYVDYGATRIKGRVV